MSETRRPFKFENSPFVELREANSLMRAFYNNKLKRENISPGEAQALIVMTHMPDPLFQAKIAATLGIQTPTLNVIIQTLIDKEYITVMSERLTPDDPRAPIIDARRKYITITDKGKKHSIKCEEVMNTCYDEIIGVFGEEKWNELRLTLNELSSIIENYT